MPHSLLVDTSVLLQLANPALALHRLYKYGLFSLDEQAIPLHYTLQNAAEFWNVSIRPADRNGHGRSIAEAITSWIQVEQMMRLLPDDGNVYTAWSSLVRLHQVRGVQVHEARLAASMLVHRIPHILTLNTADFARYTGC